MLAKELDAKKTTTTLSVAAALNATLFSELRLRLTYTKVDAASAALTSLQSTPYWAIALYGVQIHIAEPLHCRCCH